MQIIRKNFKNFKRWPLKNGSKLNRQKRFSNKVFINLIKYSMRIYHLTTALKYCLKCFKALVYVEEYLKCLLPRFLNFPFNKNCSCICYELTMHHLTTNVFKFIHYYYGGPNKFDWNNVNDKPIYVHLGDIVNHQQLKKPITWILCCNS